MGDASSDARAGNHRPNSGSDGADAGPAFDANAGVDDDGHVLVDEEH